MNIKVLNLLRNNNNPSLHLLVTMLIEDDKGLIIQEAINSVSNKGLEVDGIVGYNTIRALIQTDEDKFSAKVLELLYSDKPKKLNNKDTIMSYLGRYEGTIIHWNIGESALTTPYGVYGKAFPNSKPVRYAQSMAIKYTGRRITRRDIRQLAKINKSLTRAEKDRFRQLCWEFYKVNFMDGRVLAMLDRKSSLSWFSCSVNAGKVRGAKILQEAVRAVPDGKIGEGTLGKLRLAMDRFGTINDKILDAMLEFYKSLIRNNYKKYGIYKNGWFNRIKALR